MPDSKKDLSLDDAGAPTSDIDARASGAAAPVNDMGFDLGVTRESLDTYLARRSTKRLVTRAIRAHVAPKTPKHVIDDIQQVALVEATRHARSRATLDGWMVAVALSRASRRRCSVHIR